MVAFLLRYTLAASENELLVSLGIDDPGVKDIEQAIGRNRWHVMNLEIVLYAIVALIGAVPALISATMLDDSHFHFDSNKIILGVIGWSIYVTGLIGIREAAIPNKYLAIVPGRIQCDR